MKKLMIVLAAFTLVFLAAIGVTALMGKNNGIAENDKTWEGNGIQEPETGFSQIEEETENIDTPPTTQSDVEEGISEPETGQSDYLTEEEPVGNGFAVAIDPGHQQKGDNIQEPNGPDSSAMKARVTGGTRGRTTGVMEYELNLDISLKLRDELEMRGYTVYMTRETHDVNISNMERAQYATSVGADIAVRIHANGSDDTSVSGALTMAPSSSNPYVSYLSAESQDLSRCILDAYCESTGMKHRGVVLTDTMTGINWSTVPVTILEMGYMTNPTDDANMENEGYQQKMVQGIADGIDSYFGLDIN